MLQAAHLGLDGMGLCDRNSVAGVVRAHLIKREKGLALSYHPGARLVFADDTPDILAYPRDRPAWGRLCRLITCGNLRAKKGECILYLDDLLAHSVGLELIVMERSTRDAPPSPLSHNSQGENRTARLRLVADTARSPEAGKNQLLSLLRAAAPGRVRLAASMLYRGNDRARLTERAQLASQARVPLIAVNEVLYHHPERRQLQDVLTCIREHLTIDKAGRRLAANAERYLKPPSEMSRLFREIPEAIDQTFALGEALSFSLDELRYEYPDEMRAGFATPQAALVQLAWEGAASRYPGGIPDNVRQALDHELALIGKLNYAPYFLTVHSIVRYARSRNILCQGRGSAANSAVCYCLHITDVDPRDGRLLFERFISPERNEPPDIDVDFERERREEVIQHIYQHYGRDHTGIAATVISYRGRSAIREVGKVFGLSGDTIGALSSSIWGMGGGGVRGSELRRAGIDLRSSRMQKMRALAREIQSFPRHLSQHVGGFVITRSPLDEVVPIGNGAMADRTFIEWDKDDLDALGILKVDVLGLGMLTCVRKAFELAEKHYGLSFRANCEQKSLAADHLCGSVPEQQTLCTSSCKGEVGDPGLEPGEPGGGQKSSPMTPTRPPAAVDLPLAGGGMDRVCRSADPYAALTRRRESSEQREGFFTLATIPKEDPAVYRMLQRADSIGVFQVESRAQMSMLPRLKPQEFYDLVIEVAIVRPGPIQGDMVHPYLRRRQGVEPISYPSQELAEVLGKTLGVPLFQEQAMRIAIVAGGFTPGEADKLRRAMATFKRTGTIASFKTKLIEGMVAKNYPRDFAERCFSQIEGFGEYGFPESHAASFALLVYASAWLKCRYPDVFAAALLNSQPMGFYAPAQIVRDVREHGVEVRPIDINHSHWDATLENGPPPATRLHALHRDMAGDIRSTHALRLGFRQIKGLPAPDAKRIVDARRKAYASVRDLWLRSGLSVHVIERLADADAFGSLGLTRRQALWAAKALGRVGDSEDDLPLFRTSRATRSVIPPPERGRSAAGAEREAVGWGSIDNRDCCPLTPTRPPRPPRPEAGVADLPLSGGGIPHLLHAICDSPSGPNASPTPQATGECAAAPEPAVMLPPMSSGEEVVNDYRFLQLSLRAHPASFLRPDLIRRGIVCNEDLRGRRSGERLTVSGLVTIRQRPGTASGVIFMTIEDETAIANIIVWPKTFERFRPIIMGARYIAVAGELQQESGVIHVVARELDDLTPLLARLTENAPPLESLASADAIKRPHDENVDSRARDRRNPPRIAAPAELPDIIASDLDVPARGSAHAPARRGGSKIVRN